VEFVYIQNPTRHNIFLNSYGIKEHGRLSGQNKQYDVDANTNENIFDEMFDLTFAENDRLGLIFDFIVIINKK